MFSELDTSRLSLVGAGAAVTATANRAKTMAENFMIDGIEVLCCLTDRVGVEMTCNFVSFVSGHHRGVGI